MDLDDNEKNLRLEDMAQVSMSYLTEQLDGTVMSYHPIDAITIYYNIYHG